MKRSRRFKRKIPNMGQTTTQDRQQSRTDTNKKNFHDTIQLTVFSYCTLFPLLLRFSSVAAAVAALKLPPSALPFPRVNLVTPSDTLNMSTVYDSSHTVNEMLGTMRPSLSAGLFSSPHGSSSATVGPLRATTATSLPSAMAVFRTSDNSSTAISTTPSPTPMSGTLQSFFNEVDEPPTIPITASRTQILPVVEVTINGSSSSLTSSSSSTFSSSTLHPPVTSPSSRFARRFSYVILRLASHLCNNGQFLASAECPALLSAALSCAEVLTNQSRTLPLPREERSFDLSAPILQVVLDVDSKAIPLEKMTNAVRVELACALLHSWHEKQDLQSLSLLTGAASASIANTLPSPQLSAASAQAELRCISSLLHQSVIDEMGWANTTSISTVKEKSLDTGSSVYNPKSSSSLSMSPISSFPSPSSSSSSTTSLIDHFSAPHLAPPPPSRIDAGLLGGLVHVLAHSRDRQRMTQKQMLDYDASNCSPPQGSMLFRSSVYCPNAVRQFANIFADSCPHESVACSLALLRQSWSLIQQASDVSRQLTEMFGADSITRTTTTHTGARTQSLGPSSAQGNARARIARRQMRLILRAAILNEWDASVELYQKRRFGESKNNVNTSSSPSSPTGVVSSTSPRVEGIALHIHRVLSFLKSELQLHTEIER